MSSRQESVPFAPAALPRLGVGISGEYGVRPSIEPTQFREANDGLIHFLEFGTDTDRGLDPAILRWADAGLPTTYHFLDVNFEEPEDLDPAWIEETRAAAQRVGAAWLCGDSGLWHFGPRDRGHGLLLPPILEPESAAITAASVKRLSEATGLQVLPENPPSLYFLGRLHVLEYFAMVSELSDCGILLDLAHLTIFQHARGLDALDGLADFPLDRVIELHIAGGGEKTSAEGFRYIDDDHRAEVHEDSWRLLEAILPQAKNLKAIVYECEHNEPALTVATFERLNAMFPKEGS